jgi:hypothetical protein
MSQVLEYLVTGGTLRLGKREAALELLRSDSALRKLLGRGAGDLKALTGERARAASADGFVTFDFSLLGESVALADPAQPLNELKKRYGASLSGMLYFRCTYSMGMANFYLKADLSEDPVVMRP